MVQVVSADWMQVLLRRVESSGPPEHRFLGETRSPTGVGFERHYAYTQAGGVHLTPNNCSPFDRAQKQSRLLAYGRRDTVLQMSDASDCIKSNTYGHNRLQEGSIGSTGGSALGEDQHCSSKRRRYEKESRTEVVPDVLTHGEFPSPGAQGGLEQSGIPPKKTKKKQSSHSRRM